MSELKRIPKLQKKTRKLELDAFQALLQALKILLDRGIKPSRMKHKELTELIRREVGLSFRGAESYASALKWIDVLLGLSETEKLRGETKNEK